MACLLGSIGAVIGLLTIHTSEVAGIVGIGAVVSCLTCLVAPLGRSTWVQIGRVIIAGALTAAIGVASTGLVWFLGPPGIVLAFLICVASPQALPGYWAAARWCARVLAPRKDLHGSNRGGGGTGQPLTPLASVPVVSVSALNNQELCQAWRISYTALQRIQLTGDITQQARLVAVRQAYLDELERRDPSGFARWLSAGARPASDPGRYVKTMADPSRGKSAERDARRHSGSSPGDQSPSG